MLTAIIVRLFVEFKDELSGLIDLYSTLFGNVKIYRINYWLTGILGSLEFYFSFYLIDLFDKVLWKFMCVEIPIITMGMLFGGWLVKHKDVVKNWIRKKKISKSMKQIWEKRKNTPFIPNKVQGDIIEEVFHENPKEDPSSGTSDSDKSGHIENS